MIVLKRGWKLLLKIRWAAWKKCPSKESVEGANTVVKGSVRAPEGFARGKSRGSPHTVPQHSVVGAVGSSREAIRNGSFVEISNRPPNLSAKQSELTVSTKKPIRQGKTYQWRKRALFCPEIAHQNSKNCQYLHTKKCPKKCPKQSVKGTVT